MNDTNKGNPGGIVSRNEREDAQRGLISRRGNVARKKGSRRTKRWERE